MDTRFFPDNYLIYIKKILDNFHCYYTHVCLKEQILLITQPFMKLLNILGFKPTIFTLKLLLCTTKTYDALTTTDLREKKTVQKALQDYAQPSESYFFG